MFYFPVYALFHYYPEKVWGRIALTAVLLIGGIAVALLLYKKGRLDKHGLGWSIALWIYTLFILFMTVIGRYPFDDYRARLIPFESYREYAATGSLSELRGIIGNILMLIPSSFLCAELCKKKHPVMIAIISGAVLTLTIETLQYVTHTGTFEVDDIMHNILGVLIGILLWYILHKASNIRNNLGGKL